MDESGLVESYLAVLVDVKGEIADHIRHATVPLRQTDEEYDQDLVQPIRFHRRRRRLFWATGRTGTVPDGLLSGSATQSGVDSQTGRTG